MTLSACMVCGQPSQQGRCPEHRIPEAPKAKTPQRVARRSATWQQLSRRLRRMQPWCSIPGCTDTDLTVDHITPLAAGGAAYDVENLQVLCRVHNAAKGAQTRGDGVGEGAPAPLAKAGSATLLTSRHLGVPWQEH